MGSPRSQFIELVEQGAIPPDHINRALQAAQVAPDGRSWRQFIDDLLLLLAGLALTFATMFLLVSTWHAMGMFAKIAIAEVSIFLSIFTYCWLDNPSRSRNVFLLLGTICLGALLALYGQAYQANGDLWQLFFAWAMLMLPWASIGRTTTIWSLWIVLINFSMVLYLWTFKPPIWLFGTNTGIVWAIFLLNAMLMIVWELVDKTRYRLSDHWTIRLLAAGSTLPLTGLVATARFEHSMGVLTGAVWLVWLLSLYLLYGKRRLDLPVLTLCCLSLVGVTGGLVGRHLLQNASAGDILILSLLILGMGTGALFWLKKVHMENRS